MFQVPPVHRRIRQGEAVAAGEGEILPQLRCLPHDFLRHAADIDAGAAQCGAFYQAHPRTMFGRPARGGDAA